MCPRVQRRKHKAWRGNAFVNYTGSSPNSTLLTILCYEAVSRNRRAQRASRQWLGLRKARAT